MPFLSPIAFLVHQLINFPQNVCIGLSNHSVMLILSAIKWIQGAFLNSYRLESAENLTNLFYSFFDVFSFFYSHHHATNFFSRSMGQYQICCRIEMIASKCTYLAQEKARITLVWERERRWCHQSDPRNTVGRRQGTGRNGPAGRCKGACRLKKKAYSFMRKELSPNNVFYVRAFPPKWYTSHRAGRGRGPAERSSRPCWFGGELFLQQKMKKQWLQSVEVYITWGEGRVQLPRVQQFERIPGLAARCKTKNCNA